VKDLSKYSNPIYEPIPDFPTSPSQLTKSNFSGKAPIFGTKMLKGNLELDVSFKVARDWDAKISRIHHSKRPEKYSTGSGRL